MLTVWTMSTGGKYDDYYPQRLAREVKKYLSLPHRFICIADHPIDRVITMPPPTDYPGWWGKIGLFKPGVATTVNLWLDLDVVITGPLDDLIERYGNCPLAAPSNWAASGHGGVQSSVLVWKQSKYTLPIYREFQREWARWPPVNDGGLWGDQEWLTVLRDAGKLDVTPIYPPWVRSYKYHCTNGLPADCRVAVFHGKPDPDEVKTSWFQW